jgi:SRSO17 transposase
VNADFTCADAVAVNTCVGTVADGSAISTSSLGAHAFSVTATDNSGNATSDTITVNVTYLVGSRHENYGETGMAHLLEHMLFKGTPKLSAEQIAQGLDAAAWQRLSAGDGTKGERLYDWACCELADLDAAEYNEALSGLWTRGLLIRRTIADGKLAFFSTWCPAGTPIQTLVSVEGRRWAIEDAFETAKTELGLAHNETRSWHGWHRHVSLVMLAFAMLARVRQRANGPPPKTTLIAKLAGSLVDAGNPARSDPPGATAH